MFFSHNILHIIRIFNPLRDGWQVYLHTDQKKDVRSTHPAVVHRIAYYNEARSPCSAFSSKSSSECIWTYNSRLLREVSNTINYYRTFTESSRLKSFGKHADCKASRIPFNHTFSVTYRIKLPNIKYSCIVIFRPTSLTRNRRAHNYLFHSHFRRHQVTCGDTISKEKYC